MKLLEAPDPDASWAELLAGYREGLAEALAEVGREAALAETSLEMADLDAIEGEDDDRVGKITLEAAADLHGLAGGDPEHVLGAARDELLLAMTTAVMDVERLAPRLAVDLDPKEVQAKVEGRLPMTLAEYAALRATLAE